MNNTIYTTPDSNLSKGEDFIKEQTPIIGIFDKPMFVAVAIQIAFFTVVSVLSLLGDPNLDLINFVVGIVSDLFFAFFLVYLVRKLRGNFVYPKKGESIPKYLGVWGYFWRSILVKYLAMLLMLVPLAIMSGGNPLSPSIGLTLISFVFYLASSIFLVWLFFSSNRKAQVSWLITIFRGY